MHQDNVKQALIDLINSSVAMECQRNTIDMMSDLRGAISAGSILSPSSEIILRAALESSPIKFSDIPTMEGIGETIGSFIKKLIDGVLYILKSIVKAVEYVIMAIWKAFKAIGGLAGDILLRVVEQRAVIKVDKHHFGILKDNGAAAYLTRLPNTTYALYGDQYGYIHSASQFKQYVDKSKNADKFIQKCMEALKTSLRNHIKTGTPGTVPQDVDIFSLLVEHYQGNQYSLIVDTSPPNKVLYLRGEPVKLATNNKIFKCREITGNMVEYFSVNTDGVIEHGIYGLSLTDDDRLSNLACPTQSEYNGIVRADQDMIKYTATQDTDFVMVLNTKIDKMIQQFKHDLTDICSENANSAESSEIDNYTQEILRMSVNKITSAINILSVMNKNYYDFILRTRAAYVAYATVILHYYRA